MLQKAEQFTKFKQILKVQTDTWSSDLFLEYLEPSDALTFSHLQLTSSKSVTVQGLSLQGGGLELGKDKARVAFWYMVATVVAIHV